MHAFDCVCVCACCHIFCMPIMCDMFPKDGLCFYLVFCTYVYDCLHMYTPVNAYRSQGTCMCFDIILCMFTACIFAGVLCLQESFSHPYMYLTHHCLCLCSVSLAEPDGVCLCELIVRTSDVQGSFSLSILCKVEHSSTRLLLPVCGHTQVR